jgi:hypothetical protein
LQPEETGTFRVKAFNALMESGYSNELTTKSKPVEVPTLDPDTFVPDLTWTGALSQDWDKTTTTGQYLPIQQQRLQITVS